MGKHTIEAGQSLLLETFEDMDESPYLDIVNKSFAKPRGQHRPGPSMVPVSQTQPHLQWLMKLEAEKAREPTTDNEDYLRQQKLLETKGWKYDPINSFEADGSTIFEGRFVRSREKPGPGKDTLRAALEPLEIAEEYLHLDSSQWTNEAWNTEIAIHRSVAVHYIDTLRPNFLRVIEALGNIAIDTRGN